MASVFKHHDTLRLFVEVARHPSFSEAAEAIFMTKGAISYQMKTLEAAVGFQVFDRNARGVSLTVLGRDLLGLVRESYLDIEGHLAALRAPKQPSLTVGMSSYFASRWLSPRLMTFMQAHPEIQLRIQPMTQLFDLGGQGIDIAIRWGNGDWDDGVISSLMAMPAWPVGNAEALRRVEQFGLEQAFSEFTLLRDHDVSNAWSDWSDIAGVPHQTRKDTLIVPDPNVRVQAVIDGQGVALNDALIAAEVAQGQLFRLSEFELSNYGYFLVQPASKASNPSIDAFVKWLSAQD